MSNDRQALGRPASPPHLAGELAADDFGRAMGEPAQAHDVARWRKAERARLRSERLSLSLEARHAISNALNTHLRKLLDERFDGANGQVFSAYWPIKGEPNLHSLMADLDALGVRVALPVVETKAAPLVFRRWTRGMPMARGNWNIPVPPPDAEALIPDIMLAPLVGWDAEGYRLGYGGGYFDRTLASLDPRPFTIGIGFQSARIPTIFPQPHDIALDLVLTEAGVQVLRARP